jgi:hypothetical protein
VPWLMGRGEGPKLYPAVGVLRACVSAEGITNLLRFRLVG